MARTPSKSLSLQQWMGIAWRGAQRHPYATTCILGALVLTAIFTGRSPAEVRNQPDAEPIVVGDQELADPFALAPSGNPQTVRIAAKLSSFAPEVENPLAEELTGEAKPQVLSTPVMATLWGLTAQVEQVVRLGGGALEIAIRMEATPRKHKTGELTMEYQLKVESRAPTSFQKNPPWKTVVESRGTLVQLVGQPATFVFRVEDRLYRLDLLAVL